MRGLRRRRVGSSDIARLKLAQTLGDASLHAIEQGVEVHAATLAGKTLLSPGMRPSPHSSSSSSALAAPRSAGLPPLVEK